MREHQDLKKRKNRCFMDWRKKERGKVHKYRIVVNYISGRIEGYNIEHKLNVEEIRKWLSEDYTQRNGLVLRATNDAIIFINSTHVLSFNINEIKGEKNETEERIRNYINKNQQ